MTKFNNSILNSNTIFTLHISHITNCSFNPFRFTRFPIFKINIFTAAQDYIELVNYLGLMDNKHYRELAKYLKGEKK